MNMNMNINIIKIIAILAIGLIASPSIADFRFKVGNSGWTTNSLNSKFEQKWQRDGKANRNGKSWKDRIIDKSSGQSSQNNEHRDSQKKSPQKKPYIQGKKNQHSEHHNANKQTHQNKSYPTNKWKRLEKQPTHKNSYDGHPKHKKARNRHKTKNHRVNQGYKPFYKKHRDERHRYKRHRDNKHSYKKHSHRDYWTPWYNTRYVAPISRHYHRIGHRVSHLPKARIRLHIGGLPYFYYTGMFYRFVDNAYVVVSAPFNAAIKNLPAGFVAFAIGLTTYYLANDTYYMWDDGKDGYVVVPEPTNASQAIEEATQGRLFVYPNKGQDEDLQAKDRYECHRWAVSESNVDPTLEDQDYAAREKSDYKRGITACLVARDYTVN